MKSNIHPIFEAILAGVAPKSAQPEIDICSECKEHAGFEGGLSECCGAQPMNTDPDLEER